MSMLWHILRVSLSTSRQWSSGSFWSSASSDSNVHHGSPHCHVQKSPLRNGRFRVSQLGSCRLANALARKAPGESRDGHRKMKMDENGKMLQYAASASGNCTPFSSVFSDRKTSLVKAFHVKSKVPPTQVTNTAAIGRNCQGRKCQLSVLTNQKWLVVLSLSFFAPAFTLAQCTNVCKREFCRQTYQSSRKFINMSFRAKCLVDLRCNSSCS